MIQRHPTAKVVIRGFEGNRSIRPSLCCEVPLPFHNPLGVENRMGNILWSDGSSDSEPKRRRQRMNADDFDVLLTILPPASSASQTSPDYRSALIIYTISHGLRPSFGFEPIDDCTEDQKCQASLNHFFDTNSLNLHTISPKEEKKGEERHIRFIYNTDLLRPSSMLISTHSAPDEEQIFGELFGYPHPLSGKKYEKLKKSSSFAQPFLSTEYLVTLKGVAEDIWIWGYAQPNPVAFDLKFLFGLRLMLLGLGDRVTSAQVKTFLESSSVDETSSLLTTIQVI